MPSSVSDLMNMGGYSAAPVIIPGNGGKLGRNGKNRGGYSQYGAAFYGPGSWGDHHMGGGFYGPGYGVHMPIIRGHMGMDPTAMEYMADQFQG